MTKKKWLGFFWGFCTQFFLTGMCNKLWPGNPGDFLALLIPLAAGFGFVKLTQRIEKTLELPGLANGAILLFGFHIFISIVAALS